MASEKKKINPFHFLLALAGVVFTVTAASYWLVILRETRTNPRSSIVQSVGGQPEKLPPPNPWFILLRDHATEIFVWEVGAIAVLTFCAMGLDRYRDVREEREKAEKLTVNS
jgi:hypothetical protein